jgi:hypothetical protein
MSEMLSSGAAALGSFSSGVIFDLGSFFLVSMVGLVLTLVLTGMMGRYIPREQMPIKDPSY